MENKIYENGFEKLQRLMSQKNSRLVLGIDPTEEEWTKAQSFPSPIGYFINLINNAAPFVVGVKPNLAFFEKSKYTRNIMALIMRHAREIGLVTIMDAKRGDIMDTQRQMAQADIFNFHTDIVTLHSYSGSDAALPYLNADPNICAFIMSAMSNPSAQIQNLTAGGIKIAQHVALDAHKWGEGRIGLVVGATQGEALKDIRMAEKEYNYTPCFVLAPGLGKQGGKPFADKNSIFPISSGLTKEKYLGNMTTGQAAKYWRDTINAEIEKAQEPQSLREYAVNSLIEGGYVKTAKSGDLIKDGFFLKKGKTKLTNAGIVLSGNADEKLAELRSYVNDGTLSQDDFSALFINLRDIMGMDDIKARDAIGHLYTKEVMDSGVKPQLVGGVPYGAIYPAMQVAQNLGIPFITERKEADMTHDRIVGGDHAGKQGIIVEDVLTSGGSSVEFAEHLRSRDIEVWDVYAFLDRQQGAEENLEKADLTLHAITDMKHLKDMIRKNPLVNDSVKELL